MKSKKGNKKLIILLVLFFVAILSVNVVYAATSSKIKFCDYGGVRRTFKIIGIIINLVKIIVPLILTFSGMVGISKTIISGKFDDLKGGIIQLSKQAVAGLIIFIIPGLLDFVFDSLVEYDDSNFTACTNCLLDTNNCSIPDEDPEVYTEDEKGN